MSSVLLPNKISWSIDLSGDWQSNWSRRSLKNVVNKLDQWEKKINYEILNCKAIKKVFYPMYKQTVMQKRDYRLDPIEVDKIIDAISLNDEYQLLWFRNASDGQSLGGNVLHLCPEVVKGVYRAYDHDYASNNDMKNLDYYTDYILQKYVQSIGKIRLNRGLMGHPCIALGLSMFKLRTGARPKLAKYMPDIEYTDEMIRETLNSNRVFAYYDLPDELKRFKRLTVTTKNRSEILNFVGDTAEKAGIELVVNEVA